MHLTDAFSPLTDAFSVHRGFHNCYLFPPFILIAQTLQKIRMNQKEFVLVISKWPTKA